MSSVLSSVLTPEQVLKVLQEKKYNAQGQYLAMYSTWLQGVVTDPSLMFVPVDDHLVHRGDGVFEAIKCVQGRIYLLAEHLQRLQVSADRIALPLPHTLEQIENIILQMARWVQKDQFMIRLYISRGPGGFTTNPYESIGSQMYLVLTDYNAIPDSKYQVGVKVAKSQVPVKESWMARTKTCNYLPNVLMKKEAVDAEVDFTVAFDKDGFLAESSTENIVILDSRRRLLRPRLLNILKGTTMMRAFSLAEALLKEGVLTSIDEADITEADLKSAREVMMIGTTLDVLPVTEYEGQKVGFQSGSADGPAVGQVVGSVGPVALRLLEMIRSDQRQGLQVRHTPNKN